MAKKRAQKAISRPSPGHAVPMTASDGRLDWRRIAVAAGVVVAVAFALWLRFYRIAEPIGGFHAFNEGFYTRLAALDAHRGPFEWITSPLDANNPPLFSALVSFVFRLFSPTIAAARAVSVVSGLASAAVIYLLGRRLWGTRAGVSAGLVFLLMPGVVVVTRNAQTDALMVALGVGAVLTWVMGGKKGAGIGWSVGTGALLGLGLLTKLPVVIVMPGMVAWEIARYRGFAWSTSRRFWVVAATAAAVSLPWYLLRLVGSGSFVSSQATLASAAGDILRKNLLLSLVFEPFWMITAAGLVALVFGLVVMTRRRSLGDLLVATELATAIVFVLVFHFHSYYLLVLMPWVALAIGRGMGAIAERNITASTALTMVLVVVLGFSSVLALQGVKWGQWSPQQLSAAYTNRDGLTIQLDELLYDNVYGPSAEFYFPGRAIRRGSPIPRGTTILATLTIDEQRTGGPMFLMHSIRPIVFGYEFWQDPPLFAYVTNGKWSAKRVGPLWRFGLTDTEVHLPYVLVDDSAAISQ